MNITLIIRIICYAIGILIVVSFPQRIKQLKKSTGLCLLPLKRTQSKLFIIAIVLCFAVIAILRFRSFQLYITVIIDIACVLGINLSVRESVNRRASGVYERALITDGELFYRENIIAIPELNYDKDEETSEYAYKNTLKIVTTKGGETWIAFADAEEKEAVLNIVKSWFK
jgi:hypothetical protein